MNEVNPYYKLVIQNIVSTKTFDISEVNNLESIRSLTFEQDDYKLIVGLIKEQNWEQISAIEKAPNGFREYLDIIRFSDQNGKIQIATIYDSDELWQDPQIIDIFLLSEK
jgi:hypothetical protein